MPPPRKIPQPVQAPPRSKVERCAVHQEVRGVTDTAAFKLLGEILHHLDDQTTQLNALGQQVAAVAEEVALIKTQMDTNTRTLEELRKRVG